MQQQLFDPGPKRPSQWKNHPDKWVKRPGVVYHASDEAALPRTDRGPNIDPGYGNSTGMHFGSKTAAYDRTNQSSGRQTIHTARLNAPRTATMTDQQANYGHTADQAVRAGKVVPYINSFEGEGSTSYRVKPESVRTWSEDVQADPNAHPALKHLADRGYNPTLTKEEIGGSAIDTYHNMMEGPPQKQLLEADLVKQGKAVAHGSEDDMFAKNKTGFFGGVKRNNISNRQFSEADTVNKAKPRMRPTR